MGYLLNQTQKDSKMLRVTEDYQLTQSKDPWNKIEYIEMRQKEKYDHPDEYRRHLPFNRMLHLIYLEFVSHPPDCLNVW